MEPPINSARGFSDLSKRSWSPSARPTVNTSVLAQASSSTTPLERSPHPSSVSNSTASSPWLQQLSLTNAGQPQSLPFAMQSSLSSGPRLSDTSTPHNGSLPNSDWSSVFSSPLDPSTFAALAASGMLGPPAAGLHASLSGRPVRSPTEFGLNSRAHAPQAKEHARSGHGLNMSAPWPNNMPPPFSTTPPPAQRGSISHIHPSTNNVPYVKRKSPVDGSYFLPLLVVLVIFIPKSCSQA